MDEVETEGFFFSDRNDLEVQFLKSRSVMEISP